MTFKQTPPFIEPAFWALRMFDATNSYPVPNPINRYVLGSDYPEMKKNPDGSLTVYLQNKNPGKDKEANWLPAPAGPFLLILGTYASGQAMIELVVQSERLHSSACRGGQIGSSIIVSWAPNRSAAEVSKSDADVCFWH